MKHKNFQTQEDPFSQNARGISKTYLEVLLVMKCLQSKLQVMNMNIIYYDLYFTLIKIRKKKIMKKGKMKTTILNLMIL